MLATVLAVVGRASAQGVLDFTSQNTNGFADANGRMLGWQFSVTGNVDVAALGWFDWNDDGLSSSHQIGIWNTSGPVLLASATVAAGTADPLDHHFRYVTLGSPITLTAGNTYIIAGFDGGIDPHVWAPALGGYADYEVIGFSADARLILTAGNGIGASAGGFGFPGGVIGDSRSVLMGPNFLAPIPEPGTWAALLGATALGFALRHRRPAPRA